MPLANFQAGGDLQALLKRRQARFITGAGLVVDCGMSVRWD